MNHAKELLNEGFELVILNGKKPLLRNWQGRLVTLAEVEYWMERGFNYGIKLTNTDVMVVDVDGSDEKTNAFLQRHQLTDSPFTTKTARGFHRYYLRPTIENARNKIHHLNMPVDLLFNGAATGPGSVVANFEYQLIGKITRDLPVFPIEALKVPPPLLPYSPAIGGTINGVRNYIKKIIAVSGSGGHNATFRAACKLVEAGLTFDEVVAELLVWNSTNAVPEWSLEEILHKAKSALKKVRGQ